MMSCNVQEKLRTAAFVLTLLSLLCGAALIERSADHLLSGIRDARHLLDGQRSLLELRRPVQREAKGRLEVGAHPKMLTHSSFDIERRCSVKDGLDCAQRQNCYA